MKLWFGTVVGAIMVIGVGYIGFSFGGHVEGVRSSLELAQLQQKNDSLQTEHSALQTEVEALKKQVNQPVPSPGPESPTSVPTREGGLSSQQPQVLTQGFLQDRDFLIDAFHSVHDTGTAMEYTPEQLAELKQNPDQKDYKKELKNFVTAQLNKEIDTFQTIGQRVNPRTILVTMKDKTSYEFQLKQWHNYDDIWTVMQYKDFYLNGNAEVSNRYKLLKVENAPDEVKKGLNEILQSKDWRTETMLYQGKTYITIKTSASPDDSVELENILVSADEANVTYQAFEYKKEKDPSLINDYLLIELDYKAGSGVTFTKSLSIAE